MYLRWFNFVLSGTPVISKYISFSLKSRVQKKKFDLNKMRFFNDCFKNAEINRHFGTPLVLVFSRSLSTWVLKEHLSSDANKLQRDLTGSSSSDLLKKSENVRKMCGCTIRQHSKSRKRNQCVQSSFCTETLKTLLHSDERKKWIDFVLARRKNWNPGKD